MKAFLRCGGDEEKQQKVTRRAVFGSGPWADGFALSGLPFGWRRSERATRED